MLVLEFSARVPFLEIIRFSHFHLCVSKRSFLVLRVSDGEFHSTNKGRLEHGDEHLEVLQPACGAHEQTEVKHRETCQGPRGSCALLQTHQVGQVLLRVHWLQRP